MTAPTSRLSERLERLRLLLASSRGVFLLAMLGLISGVLAGLVIVLFRLLIEVTQSGFLPAGNPEDYESLSWQVRVLLSSAGGLVYSACYFTSPHQQRQESVSSMFWNDWHIMRVICHFKICCYSFLVVPLPSSRGILLVEKAQVSTWGQPRPVCWGRNCVCQITAFVCLSPVARPRPLLPHSILRWRVSFFPW